MFRGLFEYSVARAAKASQQQVADNFRRRKLLDATYSSMTEWLEQKRATRAKRAMMFDVIATIDRQNLLQLTFAALKQDRGITEDEVNQL